jgi:hypothetical protein
MKASERVARERRQESQAKYVADSERVLTRHGRHEQGGEHEHAQ